jgi:hypothetical protein
MAQSNLVTNCPICQGSGKQVRLKRNEPYPSKEDIERADCNNGKDNYLLEVCVGCDGNTNGFDLNAIIRRGKELELLYSGHCKFMKKLETDNEAVDQAWLGDVGSEYRRILKFVWDKKNCHDVGLNDKDRILAKRGLSRYNEPSPSYKSMFGKLDKETENRYQRWINKNNPKVNESKIQDDLQWDIGF